MKPMALLVLCSLAMGMSVAQSGTGEQTGDSFTIRVAPLKKDLTAGSPVEVRIKLTNTSQQDILAGSGYHAEGLDMGYQYICWDNSGNLVKKEIPPVGSVHDVPMLKPGESHVEIARLDRACDFSHPGEYTIQLSRDIPMDSQHRSVTSNKIMITVNP